MSSTPTPSNELTDDEILQELQDYPDNLLSDPEAWMSMSDTLKRAAEIVQRAFIFAQNTVVGLSHKAANGEEIDWGALYEANKSIELHRVSQMLYQMSLENALKGLCVQQGKDAPRSHDLVALAKEAGIQLDDKEENKLVVMSRMNELGRFRVGGSQKKGYTHGTVGFNHLDKMLSSLQQKIAKQYLDTQAKAAEPSS